MVLQLATLSEHDIETHPDWDPTCSSAQEFSALNQRGLSWNGAPFLLFGIDFLLYSSA